MSVCVITIEDVDRLFFSLGQGVVEVEPIDPLRVGCCELAGEGGEVGVV